MKTRTFAKSITGNAATRFNSRTIIKHAFAAGTLVLGFITLVPSSRAQWQPTGNNTLTSTGILGTLSGNNFGVNFEVDGNILMTLPTGSGQEVQIPNSLEIGTTSSSATRLQVLDNSGGDPVQFENKNSSSTLNFQNALSLLNVYTADTTSKPQTELAMGSDDASGTGYCIATIDAVPTVKKTGSATGDLVFGVTNGSANNNSTERVRITSTGRVGIGTSTPRGTLDVNGTAYCTAGVWTGSDQRLKENIDDISSALSKVMKLRGVEYNLRPEMFPGQDIPKGLQIGFIAQEIQQVLPEVVASNEGGFMAVNYNGVIPVVVEAMKEQQSEIAQRDSTISDLNSRVNKLEAEITQLLPATAGVNINPTSQISFFQNNPNPFNNSTTISYSIPNTVSHAELVVTSEAGGIEVMRLPLVNGSNQVEINASDLASGQYFYTVVADGITMASKKMSVVK